MQVQIFHGYPDVIGRRRVIVCSGAGPISYVPFAAGPPPSGGEQLQGLPFGWYTDAIVGNTVSTDGAIIAIPQSYGIGARQIWVLRFFAFSASSPAIGAEQAAAANLSTHFFNGIHLDGGTY